MYRRVGLTLETAQPASEKRLFEIRKQ